LSAPYNTEAGHGGVGVATGEGVGLADGVGVGVGDGVGVGIVQLVRTMSSMAHHQSQPAV
jgi:hypothetical protein